jgi:adenylate cyclase
MLRIIAIWTFFSLITSSGLWGQNSQVDSLKIAIKASPSDTNQVNRLIDLSAMIFGSQPDTAMRYAEEALEMARSLNFKKGEGYALKNIGLSYYVKGNFVEVYNYWQQSLETFESIGDQLGISNLNNNIGAVYFNYAEYSKALEYYFESLKAAEKLEDPLRMATALSNIGAVYSKNPTTNDKALDFYQRAVPLLESAGDQEAIGTANVNIGEIYLQRNDYDSALQYFEKALQILEQSGGNSAFVLMNIGNVYARQGDGDRAIDFHQKAIDSAKRKNSKSQLVQSLIGLGDTYLSLRQYQAAQQNYAEAEALADELGLKAELKDAYAGLAKSNAGLANHETAFRYQTLFSNIKDTLYNQESDRRLSSIQFQFDLEKKESEIALLTKENDLNETIRNSFIAFAGLLILILVGIFYQYRFARKSNKIITEERNRSESILLNILPSDAAQELKENGYVEAKKFEKTTVLFTDFKEFTKAAEATTPEHLVKSLDYYFTRFDEIVSKYGLEKIKTIGDAYMCVGGLPIVNDTNPADTVRAAIEMMAFVEQVNQERPEGILPFEMRLGINTGPVVAGVVGTKKFQYDIWGNTVNVASRMENSSVPGKINLSENTYHFVKNDFDLVYRGEIESKDGNKLKMYFIE